MAKIIKDFPTAEAAQTYRQGFIDASPAPTMSISSVEASPRGFTVEIVDGGRPDAPNLKPLGTFDNSVGEPIEIAVEPVRDDTIVHLRNLKRPEASQSLPWSVHGDVVEALLALANDTVKRAVPPLVLINDHDFAPIIARAITHAVQHNVPIAVGWKRSDPLVDEPALCALNAISPATVSEVTEIVSRNGIRNKVTQGAWDKLRLDVYDLITGQVHASNTSPRGAVSAHRALNNTAIREHVS